jgi:molecular chaperone DnaK
VLARDVKTGHQKVVQLKSAVDVRDEDVERMVSESVEHAFDDMAQRQWIETKRKSGDMLTATRKALAQVADRIVPEEVREIEQLMLNVEKALESENVADLRAANAALDQGTQALADYVMDLAMEEQLRRKGMLGDEPNAAPSKVEPIAPTGIEGSIPLKGE